MTRLQLSKRNLKKELSKFICIYMHKIMICILQGKRICRMPLCVLCTQIQREAQADVQTGNQTLYRKTDRQKDGKTERALKAPRQLATGAQCHISRFSPAPSTQH